MTYRTDTPPAGTIALVWFFVVWMRARFDGEVWRDANGEHLPGVTHWLED